MKIIDPKVQFASRFSPEDWQSLCANPKFIDVVERGAFDEAEVVAWIALNDEINSNAAMASVQIALNGEKLHSAACDFVRIWASKTGRCFGVSVASFVAC